ncbi:MAG: class I SAM-dependent methyltransferase [Solirubrobacterales bacterium]
MDRTSSQIPARIRLTGRALNATVARAPWLWPVLRAPMRRFFDGLADDWDTGRADSVEHMQPLASAVTWVSPEPERILDLGTGTGLAALFLAREFPRASVRGVDISEEMIAQAQRKVGLDPTGRVAFKVADAAHLPYSDDSFDLVAQLNMPPFFAETARVLRPGGFVVIAASSGPATPFYTPESVLERGFRRRGIEAVESGTAGVGTWFVGRSRAHG